MFVFKICRRNLKHLQHTTFENTVAKGETVHNEDIHNVLKTLFNCYTFSKRVSIYLHG